MTFSRSGWVVMGIILFLLVAELALIPLHSRFQIGEVGQRLRWGANLSPHIGLKDGARKVLGLSDRALHQLRWQSLRDCDETLKDFETNRTTVYVFDIPIASEQVGVGDWLWQFAEISRVALEMRGTVALGGHPRDFDLDFVSPYAWKPTWLNGCNFSATTQPVIQSWLQYELRPREFRQEFEKVFDIPMPGAGAVWQAPYSWNSEQCRRYESKFHFKEGNQKDRCIRAPPYDSFDRLTQFSAALNMMIGVPSTSFVQDIASWSHEMVAFDVRIGFKVRLGDDFMGDKSVIERQHLPSRWLERLGSQIACAMRMVDHHTPSDVRGSQRIWVFVAADFHRGPQIVKEHWEKAFPSRNITVTNTAGAAIHSANKKRLRDLYILSRTDFIVDSTKSMFALSAAAMMPNPTLVLGNKQCFNSFIPVIQDLIPRLTDKYSTLTSA